MAIIGSPEWFNAQSKNQEYIKIQDRLENLRYSFLERFSPECLSKMSGDELLKSVFSCEPHSMTQLLMFDDVNYRWFGAAGKYIYNGIIFRTKESQWKYKESSNSIVLSEEQAKEKAVCVRDMLLECITEIESSNLETINGYKDLVERIKHIFFFQYAWVIKYFQMVFPYYFPGMYADKTINRALRILGIPFGGNNNRLINCGQISLFIRKCDVNNIIFNEVYAKQWGWEDDCIPCPYAKENNANCTIPIKTINKHHYKLISNEKDLKAEAEKLETEIDALNLLGEDREAVVKIRTNQGIFREQLLSKYHKCCLCGVESERLLVASHIKPWADSAPEEKLDVNNGFLLCPNHDKVFDQGYITFDDTGEIMISDNLTNNDKLFLNIKDDMRIRISEETKYYLKYHRENIYKK